MNKHMLRFRIKRLASVRVSHPVRWIAFLVIIGVIVLAATLWFVKPETAEQRNEVIRTVAAVVGGAALLAQLWFTRETVRINTQNTAATIENQRQTQLSSLAERFYKATEQLGSESDDVRMGALYSLERLANDHEDYYLQVIEVVCAFVRRRSTAFRTTLSVELIADSVPGCPPDIESAVQILTRRKHRLGDVEQGGLDLHGAYLCKLKFMHGDFQGSDFSNAYLIGAWLWNNNFAGANLMGADLRRATLWNNVLVGTIFATAVLMENTTIGFEEPLPDPSSRMAITVSTGTGPSVTVHYGRDSSNDPPEYVASGRYLDGSNWNGSKLRGTSFRVHDLRGMVGLTTIQWLSMKKLPDVLGPRLWNPMTMSDMSAEDFSSSEDAP